VEIQDGSCQQQNCRCESNVLGSVITSVSIALDASPSVKVALAELDVVEHSHCQAGRVFIYQTGAKLPQDTVTAVQCVYIDAYLCIAEISK